MNGWIKVEEKLPEPQTDCIVWIPRFGYMICKYYNWFSVPDMPNIGGPSITHWMPLNEPIK
jgi:hypothetical protein